jgi:hypothetical protein
MLVCCGKFLSDNMKITTYVEGSEQSANDVDYTCISEVYPQDVYYESVKSQKVTCRNGFVVSGVEELDNKYYVILTPNTEEYCSVVVEQEVTKEIYSKLAIGEVIYNVELELY